MAVTDVSFDFYEGIRIVIPGALAAGLLEATLRTVHAPIALSVASSIFAPIVFTIGIGLLLYFTDAPAKSTAFSLNQPTDLLVGWLPPATDAREIVQFYFVLLDTQVPAPIRARALYMGSIFRIGFEAILLIGLFQAGIWSYIATRHRVNRHFGAPLVVGALVGLSLLLLGRAAMTIWRESRRRRWGRSGYVGTVRLLRRDLGSAGLLAVLVGVSSGGWGFWVGGTRGRDLVLAGAALLILLWVNVFMWAGATPRQPGGRPADALTCSLLLSIPTSFLIWQGYQMGFPKMTTTFLAGWLAAPLVTIWLISVRGHERRLGGAYASQRQWLLMNRRRVIEMRRTGVWPADTHRRHR